jgi:hypothetical protein
MMQAMRTIAGVALVALLAAGACGDDDSESSSDTTEEATTTTASGECQADDLDPEELESATVDDVPDGFERQPDDAGDTGPSDQAKAISDDGEDGAEEALAEFRRGYQWLWEDANGNQLISFVYEFCDEGAATGYMDRGKELTESDATDVTEFDVAELEDEATLAGSGDGYRFAYVDVLDGASYIRTMAFTDEASGTSATDLQTWTGELAVAQLDALDTA